MSKGLVFNNKKSKVKHVNIMVLKPGPFNEPEEKDSRFLKLDQGRTEVEL